MSARQQGNTATRQQGNTATRQPIYSTSKPPPQMTPIQQIAHQFREVYLSGEWIARTNLKQELSEITWEEANTKIGTLNTIAELAFHINYYIAGLVEALEGAPLSIRDQYSFDMPPIQSQADWQERQAKMWQDGERFAQLVENLPADTLMGPFLEEKYGNNFRNFVGMIEHCYYHLGQIVLLKKLVREK